MKIFQLLISIALGSLLVYTAKATAPLENSKPHEEGTRRLGQSHHQTVDLIKDATQLNTNTKESNCNAACQTCKFGCDMAIDVGPCETNCWMTTCIIRPSRCNTCLNNCRAPLIACHRACEQM